jgi:integrase
MTGAQGNAIVSGRPPEVGDAGPVDEIASTSLLAKLMAVVRPEFRSDVILLDDPKFRPGKPLCAIPGCSRIHYRLGICRGHNFQWYSLGKPDLATWIQTEHPLAGHMSPPPCRVSACRESRGGGRGLCKHHGYLWKRDGRPPLEQWTATALVDLERQAAKPDCRLKYCELVTDVDRPTHPALCRSHLSRWEARGQPDLDTFVEEANNFGHERLTFRGLRPRLRLEMQYALQQQVDAGRHQIGDRLQAALTWLATSEVDSVLDHYADDWPDVLRNEPINPYGKAFIRYAAREVDLLNAPGGWDAEFPRDIWDVTRLGLSQGTGSWRRLRFDRIDPPWLRVLAKRYLKWRITTEMSTSQIYRSVVACERLTDSLRAHSVHDVAEAEFSRQHIEQFLTHLQRVETNVRSRRGLIGCINMLLTSARQHGWADTIPASAAIYKEDYPTLPSALPRAVSEAVMARVEDPANLAKLKYANDRLIVKIIIECGRRVGEVVALKSSCLLRDTQTNEPYLRYWNQKMKREAHCPLDEELAKEIEDHIAANRVTWPTGLIAVFPATHLNPDGTRPIHAGAFRTRLQNWLDECEVLDPDTGEVARITPHQWRHTFAVRLVDSDVPLPVIARLLDHDSLAMTSHYARVSDRKARAEWERARKVNGQGERVFLVPNEDLSEAAYVAHKLAQSRHALPNGYCRLASHKSCEHLNPCFSCPLFVTTPKFLPELRRHRDEVAAHLVLNLEAKRARPAEKDAQDLERLDKIIDALAQPDAELASGVPHLEDRAAR